MKERNTTVTALRVVAVLWWCGLGMVLAPTLLRQSGIFGQPEIPRTVSPETFTHPLYGIRCLVAGIVLILLAILSLVPTRLVGRSRWIFFPCFALALLPLVYFSWSILSAFVSGRLGSGDPATLFMGLFVLAIHTAGMLLLPLCLWIGRQSFDEEDRRSPNQPLHGTRGDARP